MAGTGEWAAPAKAALAAGKADEARELVDRAYREHPEDAELREMHLALHLARAVRLSGRARGMRREAIVRRNIPYDTEFEDDPEVAKAFDEALAAIDEVLSAHPESEKGRMMKASLLFRRDREHGRPAALDILRAVAESNPQNRQVMYELRRIESPCKRCGDSGFCPRCRGRGSRRILGIESKCETCHGQGICLACGIL